MKHEVDVISVSVVAQAEGVPRIGRGTKVGKVSSHGGRKGPVYGDLGHGCDGKECYVMLVGEGELVGGQSPGSSQHNQRAVVIYQDDAR